MPSVKTLHKLQVCIPFLANRRRYLHELRPKQGCVSFTCARCNLPSSALRNFFVAGRGGFRASERALPASWPTAQENLEEEEVSSCTCCTPKQHSCPSPQEASRPGTLHRQHVCSECLQADRKPACLCFKPVPCLFLRTSLLGRHRLSPHTPSLCWNAHHMIIIMLLQGLLVRCRFWPRGRLSSSGKKPPWPRTKLFLPGKKRPCSGKKRPWLGKTRMHSRMQLG